MGRFPQSAVSTALNTGSPLRLGLVSTRINSLQSVGMGSVLPGGGLQGVQTMQPMWSPLGQMAQRRWKSRGNTYQPSTLRRKRKFGFFARAKDKLKSKILKRRRDKGRWYLTH